MLLGSPLPLPLSVCLSAPGLVVNPAACTVVAHSTNSAPLSSDDWTLEFKVALEPSCTLAAVNAGGCVACPAAAVMAGRCPSGTHTFITDVLAPANLSPAAHLAVRVHVGAALFSAQVLVQFEVMSDTRDLAGRSTEATARLRTMLVATQVRRLILLTEGFLRGPNFSCCFACF